MPDDLPLPDTLPIPTDPAASTRQWLRDVVVGLDLCPYARGPLESGRVRIAVSEADDLARALSDLWLELDRLTGSPVAELETTLLVLPGVCADDFDGFLELVELADEVVERAGYTGLVQVVAFHPLWRAADVPDDDPANATNRSPAPMLHLLLEESVSRAVASLDDPMEIPNRNTRLLRSFDPTALRALLSGRPITD